MDNEEKEERLTDEEVDKQFEQATKKIKRGLKRLVVDFKNELEQSEKDLNEKFHFDKDEDVIEGGNDDAGNG